MKLTVLNWLKDVLLMWIARVIEFSFRLILFLLPLGVFLLMIQGRGKASKISSLTAFTTDKSIWQYVFPGFILISLEPDQFKNYYLKAHAGFQSWINKNKYALAFLFMAAIVYLMIIK